MTELEEAKSIIESLMSDRKRLASIISHLENRIELMHIDKYENESPSCTKFRREWLEKESLHTEEL